MAVTSIKAVLPCEINKVWELVLGGGKLRRLEKRFEQNRSDKR